MSAGSRGRVVSHAPSGPNARAGLPASSTMSLRKCLCCNAIRLGEASVPVAPDLTDAQQRHLCAASLHLSVSPPVTPEHVGFGAERRGQLTRVSNLVDDGQGPTLGQKPPP